MESINFYDAKRVRRGGLLSDFFMFVVFMSGSFNFSNSVLCATIPLMAISVFQKSVFCPWKQFVPVSIFQEEALQVSKPFRMVSIFFKKWRFTPINCLSVVSIFQKSAFCASIPSATVLFFQKLAIRAAKALFAVLWKTKHYEKLIQK